MTSLITALRALIAAHSGLLFRWYCNGGVKLFDNVLFSATKEERSRKKAFHMFVFFVFYIHI